jgi:hypothetical protein
MAEILRDSSPHNENCQSNKIWSLVKTAPIHRLVFCGLAVYAVMLAWITGNTGFQADDWWMLSVPYWNRFPGSIWKYTVEFRRPLEGLPWLTAFPVFGFNRTFYNLAALLLLAGAALLFGACLTRAFPRRRAFVAASMLFWFFSPAICPLAYVFHMDNIWTCTLLFWGSVLAFQIWTERGSSRSGLLLPVLLYYLSTLAYDAANLLLFLVPLFVLPCRRRNRNGVSERVFRLRLAVGMGVGFLALLVTRFLLFHGGAVALRSPIPKFKQLWEYVINLAPYMIAPFQSVSTDAWAIGAGCLVLMFAAVLLFSDRGPGPTMKNASGTSTKSDLFLILLSAAGLVLLGAIPYLMAGYGAALGFHGESRIYSTSSFGLAMLFGFVSTVWSRRNALTVAKLAAVIVLGFMAMFHTDLRRSWQEAENINCRLWSTLDRQVPGVAGGTSFLFLNLQSYLSNRAIIFAGVNGLREFIRIFYNRKDIDAYYLYPYQKGFADSKVMPAFVSARGVVARGVLPKKPIKLDKLLIVERVGTRLMLLDKISEADKMAAIRWAGVTEIQSNRKLILHSSRPHVLFRGICRQALDGKSEGHPKITVPVFGKSSP